MGEQTWADSDTVADNRHGKRLRIARRYFALVEANPNVSHRVLARRVGDSESVSVRTVQRLAHKLAAGELAQHA